jgi:hypothetical protein
MFPLIGSLSVFFLGMVQARETWFPVRDAVRLVTGSGNLSEGGMGAPGVPHPVSAIPPAIPIASATCAAFRPHLTIAFITPSVTPSITLMAV